MNTHPASQPRLPANRAFVVQFQVAEPESTEVLHGRAEHMVSGKATHFASWSELQAFIEQVLTQVEERPPRVGSAASDSFAPQGRRDFRQRST